MIKKPVRDEQGFTLIELLVVVVIVGILIAIAIPLYLSYQKSSYDKSTQADMRNTVSRLEKCKDDNTKYPTASFEVANGGAAGTCAQKLNLSAGTTMNYYPEDSAGGSYTLIATNANGTATGGTKGYYCYAQSSGGAIAKKTADATPAEYARSC